MLPRLRMTGSSLKRKRLEAPEGGSAERGSVAYERQRQAVLDVSLEKFQRCHALAEPRLLRSVLIANTLRLVQEEIREEAASPAATSAVLEPRPPAEALPARPPAASRPAGPEDAGEDWMALSSEEDFSLSAAISSILRDLDSALDGGQAAPRTPLGSIENLPGEAGPWREGGPGAGPGRAERCGDSCRASEAAVFGSFEVMRSSYLRDVALDDLFLDIDTSAYERDSAPLGARTLSGAVGDELLKYLPVFSSSSASPFSHGQGVRDINELEHIMEILVGS